MQEILLLGGVGPQVRILSSRPSVRGSVEM